MYLKGTVQRILKLPWRMLLTMDMYVLNYIYILHACSCTVYCCHVHCISQLTGTQLPVEKSEASGTQLHVLVEKSEASGTQLPVEKSQPAETQQLASQQPVKNGPSTQAVSHSSILHLVCNRIALPCNGKHSCGAYSYHTMQLLSN